MQIPATAKARTAEEPAPAPVFHGPAWLADKATGLHARRRFEGTAAT
jgi:hypothetical protein